MNANTDKLYVNLSASQTRKRLKGFGHGVRRVQSAGRNQAVILHTATGQHLRELEGLLGDVSPSRSAEELGIPVENLRNLGPASAAWLREIGVSSKGDLERLGPAHAFRLIKRRRPEASWNLLWAMAASLGGRDWRDLTAEEKAELRREVDDD